MHTRDEDHFNMLHANTNRYKDSPPKKRGHTLALALRQGSSESSLSLGQVII